MCGRGRECAAYAERASRCRHPEDCGAGVEELIEQLVSTDLGSVEPRLTRHHILPWLSVDGREEFLSRTA
jgi:hypothetical protein